MRKSTKILLAISLALMTLGAIIILRTSSVLLQLFIAFALAYVLNPAVLLLEKRGIGRKTGIMIVFSVALLLGVGFAVFMTVSIGNELSRVQLNLPDYAQRFYDITPASLKSHLGIETPERLSRQLNEWFQQARGLSPELLKPLLNVIRQAFTSTISLILAFLGYLIIPVYLFYMLADMPRLKQFVESFIPARYRDMCRDKLAEVDTVLSGFIRGQLLVCLILALLYSTGLYFVGIDLAIAIGTLAGITFIIPYVGTIIGITLSMAMALLKFHDIMHPLLCLGWFGIVQTLEGMIITPRVVGNTVGLHPLVTIVALLIGGQLFGLFGMLLAVPVTAVLQVFLRSLSAYYLNSDFYRGA